MRNPPGCFRLPVKACRPQSQTGSIDRFTTVQGLVANHEQGREIRLNFPKNNARFSTHAFRLLDRPKQAFSQEEFFGKFIVPPLTNAKRVFQKTRCHRAYPDRAAVAQTFKSVYPESVRGWSRVSKPANALPTWKSAIRQVWKPALRAGVWSMGGSAKSALRAVTQKWVLIAHRLQA